MALAYLLSPTFEIVNSAGKPATGGYIEVYVAGSRVKYYCASDFDGTLHPFRIPLDSLGSNIVLADDSNAYDVYVYNRYGSLLMSRYNVSPGAGGGVSGGSITSSDGSIVVTPTANGVDLKVDAKPPTVMRCTAADLAGDGAFQFSELQRDGTSARVDSYAVKIDEGWWHYDATVRLHWAGEISGTQSVSLYTANGSDSLTFDLSYPHSETVHVSGELKATQDGTAFVLGVLGMPSGMSASMVDFGIHSIVGEGAGGKYTAGSGIVIDEANRVISIDPETVQEKLTPGTGIEIDENNVISTTVDQTYDASSTNAQSGTAVAEAIAAADNLFIALFRVTTIGEVDTAYGQGKDLICRYYSHGHVYSSQLSSLVSGIYTFTTTDGFSDYEFTLSPDGGTGAWSISSRAIPSGTQLVPEATQSDAGEVLTVNQNGTPEWAPAQAPISAGDGIAISAQNEISVDYDPDTLQINSSSSSVYSVPAFTGDIELYGTIEDGVLAALIQGTANNFILHIPGNTFHTWTLMEGIEIRLVMGSDPTFSNLGWYGSTPLSFTTMPSGESWLDEQDITIPGFGGTGWIGDVPFFPYSFRFEISINGALTRDRVDPSSSTFSSPVTFTYTTGNAGLAVKNPLPASTVSDADKVLTVNVQGTPVWAPAQAPISAGNGIDITNNVISVNTSVVATQNDLAGKQDVISDLSDIRAGAALGATAVQDPNYVHTDNNYTDADKTKLAGIQAGAEANVQSDWAESDSSSDSFIQNKPGQTNLVAGSNITIVDDAQNNTVTISATGSAQVQADWAETDNTDPSYILNKPSIPVVGTITL